MLSGALGSGLFGTVAGAGVVDTTVGLEENLGAGVVRASPTVSNR